LAEVLADPGPDGKIDCHTAQQESPAFIPAVVAGPIEKAAAQFIVPLYIVSASHLIAEKTRQEKTLGSCDFHDLRIVGHIAGNDESVKNFTEANWRHYIPQAEV